MSERVEETEQTKTASYSGTLTCCLFSGRVGLSVFKGWGHCSSSPVTPLLTLLVYSGNTENVLIGVGQLNVALGEFNSVRGSVQMLLP